MNNCCGKQFDAAYCPRCGRKVGEEEPLFELEKHCRAMLKQSRVRIERAEKKLGSLYPAVIENTEARALDRLSRGRKIRKGPEVTTEVGIAAKNLIQHRLTYDKWKRWIEALVPITSKGK